MALILSMFGAFAIIAIVLYKYIIIPAFLSPLSKLPAAHPLCSITSRWFDRQSAKQRELKTLLAAHNKYGPIVRLGPNEVSVVSREGLRKIYTAGLEKSSFYSGPAGFESYGLPNLGSMTDHRTHSTQKRMITNLFANSNIQHSEDVAELSRKIILDRLLPILQDHAKKREDVDVLKLFQWAGADFMAAFSFGTGNYTDFLADKQLRDLYFTEWDKIRDGHDLREKVVAEDVVLKMCNAVLAEESQGAAPKTGTKALGFSRLYSQMVAAAKAEEAEVDQELLVKRAASEMLDHILAAHETTGTSLTYAAYHLSLDPKLQATLRSELLTLHPNVNGSSGDLPSPASIDRLPLLDAIVKEALRLHAAVPGRQPRVVPEGGIQIHGFYIPAGTTVSSNAYCLHRNESVYPQPLEFQPYRWIPCNEASEIEKSSNVEEMKRWFWAFSSGGRMCIGSNLALQSEYTPKPNIIGNCVNR
jgi:cytochrome P450